MRGDTGNLETPFKFPDHDTKIQGRPISFPRLKRLTLSGFVECILLDVLSTFECPSLSGLSISLGRYVPEDERRNLRISAASLREIYPSLGCIDICLHGGDLQVSLSRDCEPHFVVRHQLIVVYQRNIEFFEALAKPDAFGNWLFPKLEHIRFDRRSHGALRSSMLRILTRVVIARLDCSTTMSIRSVSFNFVETESLNSAYMNTLRLLVPDVLGSNL